MNEKSEIWTNYSKLYFEEAKKNTSKSKQNLRTTSCFTNFWGRSGLSLASRKATSMVQEKKCKIPSLLMRSHAVGAVGYAEVCQPDPRCMNHPVFKSEFFTEGNRYRVRFRHSNIYLDGKTSCEICDDDDAKSCIREAAIKFGDQKRDGPFNLILFTGRTSLASNSVEFNKLLKLDSKDKWRSACMDNPDLYFALVDGLRRSPASFTDLTYYSQIVYLHQTKDKTKQEKSLVKFRLVPGDYSDTISEIPGAFKSNIRTRETGMLTEPEQELPWETKRWSDNDRNYRYLVNEFKTKLFGKNKQIKYRLQVQLSHNTDLYNYDPQMIWDENDCPWIDLMIIELTTYLTKKEVKKTYFNICDIPPCLSFPMAKSEKEFRSLQKVMISVYTKFERRSINQINDSVGRRQTTSDHFTVYTVEVVAQALKHNEVIPNVDIYIQLLGEKGRTGCHQLYDVEQGRMEKLQRRRCDSCQVECERVGELLAIIVDIEYRSLSENYYLSSVKIKYNDLVDKENQIMVEKVQIFPCYQIVSSNIFLPSGEVSLIQKQMDVVMKKERKLELCDRRREFVWRSPHSMTDRMPGQIQCDPTRLESLPVQCRALASKYTGLCWEVDPDIIKFFREFCSALTSNKMQGWKKMRIKKTSNHVDAKTRNSLSVGKRTTGKKESTKSEKTLGKNQDLKLQSNFMSVRNYCDIDTLSTTTIADMFTQGLEQNKENEKIEKGIKDEMILKVPESKGLDEQIPKIKTPKISFNDEVFSSNDEDKLDEKKKKGFKDLVVKHSEKLKKIAKLNRQVIPEGPLENMCLRLEKDEIFGSMFLVGNNPVMIKQCKKIPAKLNIKDNSLNYLLNRSKNLATEAKNGFVYIVDYKLLDGISTLNKDSEVRYMCAPIVLLYQTESNDLVPLAIQLQQDLGSRRLHPHAWTCQDKPLQWLLAKLWVACADYNYQFAVSHLFTCHLLMEPFAVATFRTLPTVHPLHKLLAPHFKNTILTNTLIWKNVLSTDGTVDRHCSLGRLGFLQLMVRYWETFNFRTLNPVHNANARGVQSLSKYYYRDDAVRLFTECIRPYCANILRLYYKTEQDLVEDLELKAWLNELIEHGFPTVGYCLRKNNLASISAENLIGATTQSSAGFPQTITNLEELIDLLASVIFTVTCQHSATHADAMDLFGYVPDIPAAMNMEPPKAKKDAVTNEFLTKTLPDQYPEAYYASLAFILNSHKPDTNIMSANKEIYFVEDEAIKIAKEFKKNLNELTYTHRLRNLVEGLNYECLVPNFILNSPEALPYVPHETLDKTLKDLGQTLTTAIFLESVVSGDLPYNSLALPVCMQFDRVLGGRSARGFKKGVGIFNNPRQLVEKSKSVYVGDTDADTIDLTKPAVKTAPKHSDTKKNFVRQNTVS